MIESFKIDPKYIVFLCADLITLQFVGSCLLEVYCVLEFYACYSF